MIEFYIKDLIKIEISELGLLFFIILFCIINYQIEINYLFNRIKEWIKK